MRFLQVIVLSMLSANTWAEDGRGAARPQVSWQTETAPASLLLHASPHQPVELRFRAMLAELEHTWFQGPYTTDSTGALNVVVTIPPEAWLHTASADYVTDLAVMITVGRVQVRAPEAYLAWPLGMRGGAVVWTAAQQQQLAAGGVLREELRVDLEPHGRLMPDVSNVSEVP